MTSLFIRVLFCCCAVLFSSLAVSVPVIEETVTDKNGCDRLCMAQSSVNYSPSRASIVKLERQLESWAGFLMDTQDAPTYLTYMDSYQSLATKGLNQYVARYVRRQLRGKQLASLHQHLREQSDAGLLKEIRHSFEVDQHEVDQYIRRLMWIRMREARRYLIRRFDQVYGLSRLSYVLGYQSRDFIADYMVQQAEQWSFAQASQESQVLEEKALKQQIDTWMSTDIDVDASDFQINNYRNAINRLTYALKNVSDQQLREAIDYYQHEQYQVMLTVIEKAMTLHFQRLRQKNNLSDPESLAQ